MKNCENIRAGKAALAKIVAGLDGVTPGPWSVDTDTVPTGDDPDYDDRFLMALDDHGKHSIAAFRHGCEEAMEFGDRDANARHAALCDPDAIRSIAAAFSILEAQVSEANEALVSAQTVLIDLDAPQYDWAVGAVSQIDAAIAATKADRA